ncbi:MAG: bifunctional glycosyltransferase family 2/GtrA family protein [Actinobacteria bacterium]|nr:bifunctional glycosyltransferase family 2/GtrA family protein [Actinomycetota bacterium]
MNSAQGSAATVVGPSTHPPETSPDHGHDHVFTGASRPQVIDVDVVIPVYNEKQALRPCVQRLVRHLNTFPFTAVITIVDNASTDDTLAQAYELAAEFVAVRVLHLDEKGRGRALRAAWSQSDASVLAYMDVDLSTDLDALLPLVAPLLSGHSDVAIGSRLSRNSRVVRGPKREFISRSYNMLLRTFLGVRFSDAQCGFKAIRADRAAELLPLVQDQEWFFDTELLALAERAGLRIHEVPVDWVDDPDSRVDIAGTAWADIKGVARLIKGFTTGAISLDQVSSRPDVAPEDRNLWRELLRFVLVGIISTAVFAALFLVFATVMPSLWANVAALLLATVANTAANRRFTFGIRGRRRAVRHQFQGFAVLGVALLITSGSLALLGALAPQASRLTELVVLTAANLVATVVRFLLFRSWIFANRPATAEPQPLGQRPSEPILEGVNR